MQVCSVINLKIYRPLKDFIIVSTALNKVSLSLHSTGNQKSSLDVSQFESEN